MTAYLQFSHGLVEIELLSEVAPLHCERMKILCMQKAYDGVVFHRVIQSFMAQSSDVKFGNSTNKAYNLTRAGTGGSDLANIKAEFSKIPFDRGILGAARAANPDSANSQFFIMLKDGHFLNGQYTAFGRVIKGMEFVDKITRGDPPRTPDKIISLRVK